MDVLPGGTGPQGGTSSRPGRSRQSPERRSLVDLGLQAPGQWLVTFLIYTKGGKLAGPGGMPLWWSP